MNTKTLLERGIQSNVLIIHQMLGDISHHANVLHHQMGDQGASINSINGAIGSLLNMQRQLRQVDAVINAVMQLGEARHTWEVDTHSSDNLYIPNGED